MHRNNRNNKNKRTNKYSKKYTKRTKTLKNNTCKKGMTDEANKFLNLIKSIKSIRCLKNKLSSYK